MTVVGPSSGNVFQAPGELSERRVSLNTSYDEPALIACVTDADIEAAIASFEVGAHRCAVDALVTRQGDLLSGRLSEASRDQPLYFMGDRLTPAQSAVEPHRTNFTLANTAVLRRAAGFPLAGLRGVGCQVHPNSEILGLPWTEKLAVVRRALGPDLRSLRAAMSPKAAADVGLAIPDFRATLGTACSPASFIRDILCNCSAPRMKQSITPGSHVCGGPGAFWPLLFLAHLRLLGIALPPLRTRYVALWLHPLGRCFADLAFTPAQATIMRTAGDWAGRMTTKNQALVIQALQSLLLSSDVSGPEDLSEPLAARHLDCLTGEEISPTYREKTRTLVSVAFNGVVQTWNQSNPDRPILGRCKATSPPDRSRSHSADQLHPRRRWPGDGRQGDPFWFMRDAKPETVRFAAHQVKAAGLTWAKIFQDLFPLLRVKDLNGHRNATRHWIRYVDSIEDPPRSVTDVIRLAHINDVLDSSRRTFRRYLAESAMSPGTRNDMLGAIGSLFGLHLSARGLDERANPIRLDLDRFLAQLVRGKTPRTPLAPEALHRLKAFNRRNDFAFSRSLVPDVILSDRSPKMRHHRHVAGPGGTTLVWWPGLAVLLDVMLTFPLRGFQARWLDSGEGDENELDLETLDERPNPLPTATRGRSMGVFRAFPAGLGSEGRLLGLSISTNKVAVDRDGRFGIPWCPDDLRDALSLMAGWQRQHNPINEPVPADEHAWAPGVRNEEVNALIPRIYPLFRDPARPDGRPPSYQQVQTYWNQLCAAVEDEGKKGQPGCRLTRDRQRGTGGGAAYHDRVALHDLHCLRVSGITALIEAGLPPTMVKEIVGHATVVMTLYYHKVTPGTVNSALAAAFAARERDVEKLVSDIENGGEGANPQLFNLRPPEDAAGPGMLRSAIGNGSHQVLTHGICPGGDCRTGGEYLHMYKDYGPVPRAGACALCRYRVTGPMFLAGLVVNANKIMSELYARGQELRRLNDAVRARRRQDQASSAFEARREVLHRELEDLWTEWAAEYRYVQDSLALLSGQSRDEVSSDGLALLSGDAARERVGVRTEQRHAFHLAQLLSEASAHVPSDRHATAISERDAFLNEMLANNDVEPFLLRLDPDTRLAAGNLLGQLVASLVPDLELDALRTGQAAPDRFAVLKEGIAQLARRSSDGVVRTSVPAVDRAS